MNKCSSSPARRASTKPAVVRWCVHGSAAILLRVVGCSTANSVVRADADLGVGNYEILEAFEYTSCVPLSSLYVDVLPLDAEAVCIEAVLYSCMCMPSASAAPNV